MLTTEEKIIAERFIELHKQHGGTVSHDTRFEFAQALKKGFFNMNPITSKLIALNLIEYTLSDRTGMTSLTKDGWNFTTFKNHELMLQNKQEIDRITIEKLKIDLVDARRKGRMFWPITILTIVLGIFTGITSLKSIMTSNSQERIQLKQRTTDSILRDLESKIEESRVDTAKHVSNDSILE